MQKPVQLLPITPPPSGQDAARNAAFAAAGEHRNRYHLPEFLDSASPVGYRVRVALGPAEAEVAAGLLSLEPPLAFVPGPEPTERELFDEAALGILSARQSTNYRGHEQIILGPADSAALSPLLEKLGGAPRVLPHATHTLIALSRPYRTPFTFLLTFVGHAALTSPFSVAKRAWNKRFHGVDDIPTIGFLQHLHVGIWADSVERAAALASCGLRRANVILAPFSGEHASNNEAAIREIEAAAGVSPAQRAAGFRVAFVAQIGNVPDSTPLPRAACRTIGANLMAFRSERIQPGVNAEEKAPPQFHARQDMDVSPALTEMAGRAGYNAFCRWTGVERERAKALMLIERVDVLTPNGKQRLRDIRTELESVTDALIKNLPSWVDLPTGRALSKNALRGKKAFALAGQRIYIGGLSRPEIESAGLDFVLAVRAFGAAASRSALVCELSGCIELPRSADLLAGICLMAGPVNQNDIGKQFYGGKDLLDGAFAGRSPTSLLVWTLKAKTVADPIGNEEQLLNAKQKGALVDLRPAPHEVISVRLGGQNLPFRRRDDRVNAERAFGEVGNFVVDAEGKEILGNRGSTWPVAWGEQNPWSS
jgi:hypothetical protein